MIKTRLGIGFFMTVAGLFTALPALADIPPPDSCNDAGAACSTAGANADEPGICTKSECTRSSPNGTVTYECLRCIPGPAPKPTPTPGPKASDPKSKDAGGCSVGHFSNEGLVGGGMLALGLAALVFARRRR
jgi:hypothetical protein